MSAERQVYQMLRETPELPVDLFAKIEKKIARKSFNKKMLFSVAAALVLSIGSLGVAILHYNQPLDKEVVSELNDTINYLNGSDLDQDVEMYAIIENY